MSRLSPALAALSLMAAVAATPAEAALRAFVSSSGNDANTASGCGIGAPCRSFASAQTVVGDGGEIVALDAAGYGPITVTKNVTITANPGFYAGIAVASGIGVNIATAGIKVILRGLNINATSTNSTNGIQMTNGASLSVENCVISNFSANLGSGIFVDANAPVRIVDSLIRDNWEGVFFQGGARASVSGTKILGSGDVGVFVAGAVPGTTTTAAVSDAILMGPNIGVYLRANDATGTARASVTRSTLSNNAIGAVSDGNGPGTVLLTVSNSMVTGNDVGFAQSGIATLNSLGNNTLDQNNANTAGTITTISSM